MAEGFRYFTSSDSGAPTLTGQNGSLISVMDWLITLPPDTSSAADNQWVKEYSGTNKAAYRAKKGHRLYLRVQDDGPTAQGAREAGVRVYSSMSDVDTGTVVMPTAAQETGSGQPWIWRKSNTADATSRPYFGIITARSISLWTQANSGSWSHGAFGDAASCAPDTDAFNAFLSARIGNLSGDNSNNIGPWGSGTTSGGLIAVPANNWTLVSTFIWKSRTGSAESIPAHFIDWGANTNSVPEHTGDVGGPQIMQALIMQRNDSGVLAPNTANRYPRLFVPFSHICNSRVADDGDTFAIGSRQFRVVKPGGTATTLMIAVETSNTCPLQP